MGDRRDNDRDKVSLFESFWGGTHDSRDASLGGSFCARENVLRDDEPTMMMSEQESTDISIGSVGNVDDEEKDQDEEKGNEDEEDEDENDNDSEVESEEGIDPFGAMVIGAICCWCKPVRIQSFKDWLYRTIYWTGLNKDQILGGLVVAAGQVPEVASYAIMAGVSPKLALEATWLMGILTSIFGGRPGIINGATAAAAIASINLVNSDGVSYLFYAIMLASFLQMAFGVLQFGKFLRFVPYSAMVGYANAMALIIAFTQLKFYKVPGVGVNAPGFGEERLVHIGNHGNNYNVLYGLTPWLDLPTLSVLLIEAGLTLLICIFFPKMTKIIPGTFVALVFVTILEWALARQVGYPGTLIRDFVPVETPSMPRPIFMDSAFSIPPINFDTFKKVWPTSIAMFAVTTVENLLAFRVVGDKTETKGSSNRMMVGQGLAQFVSALLGGMGGGAQLSQSIINYKSGGVTCLSNFFAGLFLFLILAGAYPAVGIVPLGAIAGIMLYSVYNLAQWTSFVTILSAIFPQRVRDMLFLDCKVNRSDTFIMLAVMAFAVFLDLAWAAFAGATIAAFAFSWDSSERLEVDRVLPEGEDTVTYRIRGSLFYSTSQLLLNLFTQEAIMEDPSDVILYLQEAEIHDWSGQVALKTLYQRIESCGKTVALSSLTATSKKLMEKNSSMWYGVVFLEVEEMDEEALENLKNNAEDDEDSNAEGQQMEKSKKDDDDDERADVETMTSADTEEV